jgi:hypothetical protein
MPGRKAGTVVGGIHGRLQWHYHVAADVQGFTVDRDERGQLFLRAAVTTFNEYRLAQTPLTFIVTVKGGEWTWPVVKVLSFADHALWAHLGAPLAKPRRTETHVEPVC